MCMFSTPKVPEAVPAAERQPMVAPKDMAQGESGDRYKRHRRGMWASIFTGPAGVVGSPNVTGSGGSITGG